MKKWICSLLVLLCLISAAPMCMATPETAEATGLAEVPEVKAQNVLLQSLETGAVIYEKNADEQIYPASTTKIMTLILALENCKDLEAEVTASDTYDDDLIFGSSGINVKEGEVFTVTELLYAVSIASANDAANVLAEYVGGSIANFIDMMNAKATEIGCKGTHFANVHGLPNDNHYTTARDMSLMMQYGMKLDLFQTLMSTYAKTIPATNKSNRRVVSTTNAMISQVSSNYYKYACGGKTGTTTPAGYNLVSWAKKGEKSFLCVAMHADKASSSSNPIFSDSKKLYEWAFDNFSLQQIVNTKDPQIEIKVKLSAEKDYVVLCAAENLSAVLPNDTDLSTMTYEKDVPEEVLAPIAQGDEIGTITISRDGVIYGKTKLVAGEDISRSTVLYYLYCIQQFFSNLWVQIACAVLGVLLIIYIIVMIRRNRRRRRRRVRFRPRIRY